MHAHPADQLTIATRKYRYRSVLSLLLSVSPHCAYLLVVINVCVTLAAVCMCVSVCVLCASVSACVSSSSIVCCRHCHHRIMCMRNVCVATTTAMCRLHGCVFVFAALVGVPVCYCHSRCGVTVTASCVYAIVIITDLCVCVYILSALPLPLCASVGVVSSLLSSLPRVCVCVFIAVATVAAVFNSDKAYTHTHNLW